IISRMLRRRIHNQLIATVDRYPAVALIGPRQAGKTTLALETGKNRPSVYLDLELPSDRAKLRDAEDYFAEHRDELIILDEVHRTPEIFQTLRGVIDQGRRRGRAGA